MPGNVSRKPVNIAEVEAAAARLKRDLDRLARNHRGSLSQKLDAAKHEDPLTVRMLNSLQLSLNRNWFGGPPPSGPWTLPRAKAAIDQCVKELKAIDEFKGAGVYPANRADGVVTSREVKNYGGVPELAKNLLWYVEESKKPNADRSDWFNVTVVSGPER